MLSEQIVALEKLLELLERRIIPRTGASTPPQLSSLLSKVGYRPQNDDILKVILPKLVAFQWGRCKHLDLHAAKPDMKNLLIEMKAQLRLQEDGVMVRLA